MTFPTYCVTPSKSWKVFLKVFFYDASIQNAPFCILLEKMSGTVLVRFEAIKNFKGCVLKGYNIYTNIYIYTYIHA